MRKFSELIFSIKTTILISSFILVYILCVIIFNIEANNAATLFVAICALTSSLWFARENRNHNKLTVKPKLKFIHQIFSPNKSTNHFCSISIKNVGIGPAILNNIIMKTKGQKIDLNDDKPIHKALKILFNENYSQICINHYGQMNIGTVIGVNEEFEYLNFSVPMSVVKSDIELKEILNEFNSFTIEYESFYGEKDKILITEFK